MSKTFTQDSIHDIDIIHILQFVQLQITDDVVSLGAVEMAIMMPE